MSQDKRYPAFLLIAAVLLGFFLFTSNTSQKEPTQKAINQGSVLTAAPDGAGPRKAKAGQSAKTTLPVFPININKATVQELTLLPGIGEKTAQRIVEKRSELNGFRTVDDLTAVKWIGKVKLEKIRALVTVSAANGQGQSEK